MSFNKDLLIIGLECSSFYHVLKYCLNFVNEFQQRFVQSLCKMVFFLPGSGELEFEEFCILSAKFLIEEDEESLKEELKEAFRIYDKEGQFCQHLSQIDFKF